MSDQAEPITLEHAERIEAERHVARGRAEARRPTSALGAVWFGDVKLDPTREGLVRGVLPHGALALIYGPPGCGKSFLATDIAAHIALGWDWRGRAVEAGTVVYVSAEGGRGMLKRVAAFRQHHQIEESDPPLVIVPSALNLLDPDADVKILSREASAAAAWVDAPLRLIVIDTLSRTIAGGNENGPDDMGGYVRNCDRLRQETGAAALIIHHTGRDKSNGARGHSSLHAAVDLEIEVDKLGDTSTARIVKNRDGETGESFGFDLKIVELGQDEDGEPITSCVVFESEPISTNKTSKLSHTQQLALRALTNCIAQHGQHMIPKPGMAPCNVVSVSLFREHLKAAGVTHPDTKGGERMQWKRLINSLECKGQIAKWNDQIWLA